MGIRTVLRIKQIWRCRTLLCPQHDALDTNQACEVHGRMQDRECHSWCKALFWYCQVLTYQQLPSKSKHCCSNQMHFSCGVSLCSPVVGCHADAYDGGFFQSTAAPWQVGQSPGKSTGQLNQSFPCCNQQLPCEKLTCGRVNTGASHLLFHNIGGF